MTEAAAMLDMDALRQWIGRQETAEEALTPDLVRKFRATLSLPGEDLAAGTVAPRLIHFCLAQPVVPAAGLGPDGHPARGGFLPPVPLPRRMWAGGAFTFHDELRIGDMVRRNSRIVDVVLKEGRTGPLCFVTVDHQIMVGERAILDERQDLVYRAPDAGGAGKAPEAAPPGAVSRAFDTSATCLFRYSALTFNGHRIHYDRRHAIEAEGYRGLVVHGPMQATLLLYLAEERRGTPARRFTFRGLSPLFDDDQCQLHADDDGGSMRLWTARKGGPVAMSAEAHWD